MEKVSVQLSSGLGGVKTLPELVGFLRSLSDKDFSLHVSLAHHAVAGWLFEVYGNEKLSRKVRKIHHKKKLLKVLERELKKQRSHRPQHTINKIRLPRSKRKVLAQLEKLDNHLNVLTAPHGK